jgi:hypothetical protein
MRTARVLPIFAFALAALPAATGAAPESSELAPRSGPPRATRIFFLDNLNLQDVTSLLRSQVRVRSFAVIQDEHAVVVSDVADTVDQAEGLLTDLDPGLRAVAPHPALRSGPAKPAEIRVHVLRLQTDAAPAAVTIVRSIYPDAELTSLSDGIRASVRAEPEVLAAIVATLRELGLLAEPSTD